MNNVQFDEEQYSQTSFKVPKPSKMAGFLIRVGLAKDEKSANVILIGVIVVMAIIFFISISGGNSSSTEYDSAMDDPSVNI